MSHNKLPMLRNFLSPQINFSSTCIHFLHVTLYLRHLSNDSLQLQRSRLRAAAAFLQHLACKHFVVHMLKMRQALSHMHCVLCLLRVVLCCSWERSRGFSLANFLILPGSGYFQAGACVARHWAFTSENAAKLPNTFFSSWNFPFSLMKFKLLCKSGRFKLLYCICLSKELLPHNDSHCILHSPNCCCEVCGQPALCAACF